MKDYIEYKGYISKVNYSQEDNCLYGKVEGVKDLLSIQGSSVEELQEDLINAVDDYLDHCKEIGKQPEKYYKGVFNVRTSSETHKKLSLLALKENTNLNEMANRSFNLLLKNQYS